MLSSVGFNNQKVSWEEVPAGGIYALKVKDLVQDTLFEPTLFPWKHTVLGDERALVS